MLTGEGKRELLGESSSMGDRLRRAYYFPLREVGVNAMAILTETGETTRGGGSV